MFTSSNENLEVTCLPNLAKEDKNIHNKSRNVHRTSNANTETDVLKYIKDQNRPSLNANSSFDLSNKLLRQKKQCSKFYPKLNKDERSKFHSDINCVVSNQPTRLLYRNSNFTKPLIESERDLSCLLGPSVLKCDQQTSIFASEYEKSNTVKAFVVTPSKCQKIP